MSLTIRTGCQRSSPGSCRLDNIEWSGTNNPAFAANAIPLVPARAAACVPCPRAWRQRLASADSNESVCAGTAAVRLEDASLKLTCQGNDLMQKYGFGHWQFMPMQGYVKSLYKGGILGKGKKIEAGCYDAAPSEFPDHADKRSAQISDQTCFWQTHSLGLRSCE
jgi:hypothetical protein